jgi:hypothetical protein
MHSEALAQAVLVTQTADAPPPHICEFVHFLPFQDSTLCEKELPMTHMVRLAHDGTDDASRGSAIFSHLRPFHRNARIVIADLNSRNPNVFYETGIAHTLGRDVIQIAQSIEDVPFDLRAIRS